MDKNTKNKLLNKFYLKMFEKSKSQEIGLEAFPISRNLSGRKTSPFE